MKHGKRSLAFSFVVMVVAVGGLGLGAEARAEQPAPPADTAAPAGGATGAPAIAEPDRPYRSPMEAQCTEELRKDKVWFAELKDQVRASVHQEDANRMVRNNRHVVLAYAAIWILTVGFVFFLWTRQSALRGEIARLERDLATAAGDGSAGAAPGGGKGSARK